MLLFKAYQGTKSQLGRLPPSRKYVEQDLTEVTTVLWNFVIFPAAGAIH